jgi:Na+/H+ antiporter NhaC
LISILRASTLVKGQVEISTLAMVILLSLPAGLVEGYGIFQAIKKTLKKSLRTRDLAFIYGIFLVAAVVEVGFVQLLLWISAA